MLPERLDILLLIRADATEAIGTGHVMRCLALAEACIARGGSAVFLTRCDPEPLRRRIADCGAAVVPVPTSLYGPEDARWTRETASGLSRGSRRAAWLVLDGYAFDPAYQAVARGDGVRTLFIDDMARHRSYHAEVLLNQNLGAEELEYAFVSGAVGLFGPAYALVRAEFRDHHTPPRARRHGCDGACRVLVTMGGADAANHTGRVVRALAPLPPDAVLVRVVAGQANPHLAELRDLAAHSPVPVEVISGVDSMAPHMEWADLAIAAAGSTVWELSFMGVPSILLTAAENQQEVASGMAAAGAALSLGPAEAVSDGALLEAVRRLVGSEKSRRELSERAAELVDGQGPTRVLRVLEAIGSPAPHSYLALRPARPGDALGLLRLANDPTVRANALRPQPIPRTDHIRWFGEKLESGDTRMWVLELEGAIAGQIRYDRTADDRLEISFAVAPAFRGLGVGSDLLRRTWSTAARELGADCVFGLVITGNVASARAFEKAGFRRAGEVVREDRLCQVFERRLATAALPANE